MNRELDRIIKNLVGNFERLNLLEISGNRWKVSGDNGRHTTMNYPDFDICKNKLDEKFNLIISEMVFEHLPYPYRAGKNVYEMLDSPGFFVISVPFMFPIHNHPIDCTRWSRDGLKYFLEECGFEPGRIHTDAWGNRDCVNELTPNPVAYDETKHSLVNDPNYPVSVWAIAQK